MKNNIVNISFRYIQYFIALFIAALSFNIFLRPIKLVAGGVNGISIILEKYFNTSPTTSIFLISLICLLLSITFLGIKNSASTFLSTVFYPLFVKLSTPIAMSISMDTSDLFLISIISGTVLGISTGIIYRNNFNHGNLGVIPQIIYKYFHISIGKSNLVMNTIIVVIGAFSFGWTNAMYGIIVLFVSSVIMDKVMLGISSKKAFYIITKKSFEVERFIIDELNHSVTIFNAKGGFLIKNKKMLMAVVPTREYYMLTEGIKEIDPNAFFLATDAYQSYGEQ